MENGKGFQVFSCSLSECKYPLIIDWITMLLSCRYHDVLYFYLFPPKHPLEMVVFYETIPSSLQTWILEQKVLWVASAPLSASGHVNVSPKGGQYFGIVDSKTFWYLDLTGSGIETLSHLHEPGNGRITIMFHSSYDQKLLLNQSHPGRQTPNRLGKTPAKNNFKIAKIPSAMIPIKLR